MKTERCFLSIIMPVYNAGEYLSATLENVLAQSYEKYELILVDDGSTDGSGDLCDGFAERDPRIRVIHQKNAGVSAARNAGVDAAGGEYVGFVDSDDLIEPEMFSTLTGIAEQYDADVVQCRHNRLGSVQNVTFKTVRGGYGSLTAGHSSEKSLTIKGENTPIRWLCVAKYTGGNCLTESDSLWAGISRTNGRLTESVSRRPGLS